MNRFQGLPRDFIAVSQQYYQVDLKKVGYATGIDTVHGDAITWNNRIFFPEASLNFAKFADVHLMLHELEHVVQYRRKGEKQFLTEYISAVPAEIIACQCFNVHDLMSIEQAAESKADQIADSIFNQLASARAGNSNSQRPPAGYDPLPQAQRWASTCRTQVGICALNGVQRGFQCYCPTPNGWYPGVAY
ncbi:DUF4157 domain-containing protein [Phyllobacterium sp. A18/5-2]|uniref:eCIS core domain-containing protein n=1 Tax=Phyllobacterium sp. A18/5-2 TaxID=2978392 RepID=UPI0039659E17